MSGKISPTRCGKRSFFIHFHPPSTNGFDETAPSATAITEEGQEYFAKTCRIIPEEKTVPDGHTYEVWQEKGISKTEHEVLELFLREKFKGDWEDSEKYAGCSEKGQWLCIYMRVYRFVFVRKDFYNKFISEWKKQIEEKQYLHVREVARNLLNPCGRLPQLMHSETPAILEDEERLRKAQSGQRYY